MAIDTVTICYDDGVSGSEVCQSSQQISYPVTLLNGLVAWYDCNETGTNNCADATSTVPDLLIHPTWGGSSTHTGSGKSSNGMDFAGDGVYYMDRTTTGADTLEFSGDFSISCWINPDNIPATGDHYIIHKSDSGGGWALATNYVTDTANKVAFFIRDTADRLTSNSTITTGAWYHVVATFTDSTSTMNLYVNDDAGSSRTTSAANGGDAYQTFWMGGEGFFSRYNGQVDELGFWNRVLNSGEITDLYNSGSGKFYPAF